MSSFNAPAMHPRPSNSPLRPSPILPVPLLLSHRPPPAPPRPIQVPTMLPEPLWEIPRLVSGLRLFVAADIIHFFVFVLLLEVRFRRRFPVCRVGAPHLRVEATRVRG